jgi:sialic acid synthase SpsE
MIVAEIGQNHNGDMILAEKLIGLAYDCGADWVKFQLYDSAKLYGKKQKSELSRRDAFHLFDYAEKEVGIPCYFSVTEPQYVQWCEDIGVKAYKIAFSQRNNIPLIDCIKETGKQITVSSDEILPHIDPEQHHYLYCIPKYPATNKDIWSIKEKLTNPLFCGFSDHFIGTNVAKIALALGTWQIEKHFAVDHKTGVDAPWSMTPYELNDLADYQDLRNDIIGDKSMEVFIPCRKR